MGFGAHFGSKMGSKMDLKIVKIPTRVKTSFLRPLPREINVFGVKDRFKIAPKHVKKNTPLPDPSKFADFRVLEPLRQDQEAKRSPKGSPKGGQNGAKMATNDVRDGLEVRLASKEGPQVAQMASGGCFLRPFGVDF